MNLKPRVGVDQLKLGMSCDNAMAMMGPPKLQRKNFLGELQWTYGALTVTLSPVDSSIVEIGIIPLQPLLYHGKDLFSDPTLWRELVAEEGTPYEHLGFIILPSLQLTLTRFHDHDASQKAVTLFAAGRWDHLRSKLKPLKPSLHS